MLALEYGHAELLERSPDGRLVRVVEREHGIALVDRVDPFERIHRTACCRAISAYEPAGAELDPAEVANDHQEHIADVLVLQHVQHGLSRGPCRLTVVVRAHVRAVAGISQQVGRAMMRRVRELAPPLCKSCGSFFRRAHPATDADEAAPFDLLFEPRFASSDTVAHLQNVTASRALARQDEGLSQRGT